MEIRLESLCKTRDNEAVLQDISLHMEAGQIVGCMGPNGAGKTTLLQVMATLQEPTSGEIWFDRISATQSPEKVRPMLGYMPETLPAHRDLTVHEYLDFYARAYGLQGTQRKQTLEEVEAFTHLTEHRHQYPAMLSLGQRQRINLARTLLHNPSLLLLDEPAARLDLHARIELRELLRALAAQGKIVFLSSHVLHELSELCTHAVFLSRGRVVKSGALDELFHHTHEPEAAPSPLIHGSAAMLHGGQAAKRAKDKGGAPHADPARENKIATAPPLRTILHLRTLDDQQRLLKELPMYPSVLDVREVGKQIEAEIEGGDDICRALLLELMWKGFSIVEFFQPKNRLEELFLHFNSPPSLEE